MAHFLHESLDLEQAEFEVARISRGIGVLPRYFPTTSFCAFFLHSSSMLLVLCLEICLCLGLILRNWIYQNLMLIMSKCFIIRNSWFWKVFHRRGKHVSPNKVLTLKQISRHSTRSIEDEWRRNAQRQVSRRITGKEHQPRDIRAASNSACSKSSVSCKKWATSNVWKLLGFHNCFRNSCPCQWSTDSAFARTYLVFACLCLGLT